VKCLHDNLNEQALLDIINEISCMCNLDDRNLIKLHGVVLNTADNRLTVMMVTELAPFGSLLSYLRTHKVENRFLDLSQLYSYVYQIACGMAYLESRKVLHRDLAARNILLVSLEHIKICDFGMARSVKNLDSGQYSMKETHKIPCAWYAPESIREKIFSVKSDVWSFGVTVWEVLTLGEQPWSGLTAGEIFKKLEIDVKRLPKPYMCSKFFYQLLLTCWSKAPADRPSFHTLKEQIRNTKIIEMRAKSDFEQESKLAILRNDVITIIEGNASFYWWKGQNKRTLHVGQFPRLILDPERKLRGEDISLPLKNSFIHTGHAGISGKDGKTWGNPGKIDEIFLKNPLNPPDLLENIEDDAINEQDEKEYAIVDDRQSSNVKKIRQDDAKLLSDLIDFSSDDLNITYPQSLYNKSGLSFSKPSTNSSSPEWFYVNDQYMTDRLEKPTSTNGSGSFASASTSTSTSSSSARPEDRVYYNDSASVLAPTSNNYCESFRPIASTAPAAKPLFDRASSSINATKNLNPLNPFWNDSTDHHVSSSYQNAPSNRSNTSCYLPTFVNGDMKTIANTKSTVTVDDLLSKVMNDVLNDFKNLKN
jgi:serine/threonine protein kinase